MKDKAIPEPSPFVAGDELTAPPIATEHAAEAGWEAVRLSRSNLRP